MADNSAILDASLQIIKFGPQFSLVLTQKLQKKGFFLDEIANTIDYLVELGYIDDEATSLLYARSLFNGKLYGKMMVLAKLLNKGVSKFLANEVIEQALQEFGGEAVICARYVHKKKYTFEDLKNEKVIASLMRRGFSFQVIKLALSYEE